MGKNGSIIQEIKYNRRFGAKYFFWTLLSKLRLASPIKAEQYVQLYYRNLTPEQREKNLKDYYYSRMGYSLNLENPKTFNEKVIWTQLYDSTPEKTRLADKVAVRDWVKEKIGGKYLVPIIGVWSSFEEIDFDVLPEEYVLQCNHGSGMVIIVRKNQPLNKKYAKKMFNQWLNINLGLRWQQELQYRDIHPQIIGTKYLENTAGDLYDYKIYCFNGIAKFVQIIKGRYGDERMSFYDLDWNKQNFYYTFGHMREDDEFTEKPKQMDKAVQLAEELSVGFAYARVDFYLLEDNLIYFGEMTFTPMGGIINWSSQEANQMLGDMMTLPKEKYILPRT